MLLKKCVVILCVVLYVLGATAQSTLRIQHINVEDGLSQSSVNYIFQDTHGFMWFATGDGLNRYDGREFTVYKSHFNDTFSSHLKYRTINSVIFEDKNNRLWLSTDEGICYFDWWHGKYTAVIDKFGVGNAAVMLARDGDLIWSAVPQSGLYAVNVNNSQYRHYPFSDKWQMNTKIISIINNGILTTDGLWIADKAGLLLFNKNMHTEQRIITNDKFTSVNSLHNGQLLLTAIDGIYLYDIREKSTKFIPVKYENDKPTLWKSCAEDTITHTVYLGASNKGIICKFNLATQKYNFIVFQNSEINCLHIDNSQNLWIGTEGNGAYKLDIKQPKFFCYAPQISSQQNDANTLMVKSIYRDDSGKIWFGTYGNGLIKYDPITQAEENVALPFPVDNKLISSIIKDSAGKLVVSAGSTILWLDNMNGKILAQTRLPVVKANSPEEPVIYSLLEWKKDHYLAGTNLGMFSIKNENGKITVYTPDMLMNKVYTPRFIYNLYEGKDGVIYIGQRSGFIKIQMLGDTVLSLQEHDFEYISVRHFYKSIFTPILWIATEKGLVAYNETTKRYKVFDETNGLTNSFVYAILAQNDSNLWISTNHGLSNLKVHYENNSGITAQCFNYTSKDGLQSNEFNTGAYYKCSDGTLMFGGIAGINWFDPQDIQANPYKAKPTITGIYINDTLYAADTAIFIRTLALPYSRNTISLSIRALEFTQPEQNQFAYKLEGLDKDWVYTTNDKVRYSNLAPGTYQFLLRVSNNDHVWTDDPLKIRIIIQPPFWKTWWFRSLIAAFIIMIIYSIGRFFVRQKIKNKTKELEKEYALNMERLRISKDVHDDIGSGLSKISLIAEMAYKKATGNQGLGNDINDISTTSKELVDNMRDLIWTLNPENTTLENLAAHLREYCADYLERTPFNIRFDFPVNIPSMPISTEAQRNIFLTVKEAINNCVKHSNTSEISITLKSDSDLLNILIHDNGKGFQPDSIKGSGNGLRNMKHRIEELGGAFSIISSESTGTVVNIVIPFEKLKMPAKNPTKV